MSHPIIVSFPLKGEWHVPHTPGTKIPSYGTDRFGTRYAYDFIQVDWSKKGLPAYRQGFLRYLLFGMPLTDYYCWGQPVYAPFDGVVVEARDGYLERSKTHIVIDFYYAWKNNYFFNLQSRNVQEIAENFIIIRSMNNVYAALVHLQTGSIRVSVGQKLKKGEHIGNVGHSGNSFALHLHFQLMDSADLSKANGLLCSFEEYELFQNGEWIKKRNGIPTSKDRIRFL